MRNYIKELAERIANTKGVIQILALNADFLKGLLKDIGDLSEEAVTLSIANSRLKERVEKLESTNKQQARDLLEFSAMVDTRSVIIGKFEIDYDFLKQCNKTQAATIEARRVEIEKLRTKIRDEIGFSNDTSARLTAMTNERDALRQMNDNQRSSIEALIIDHQKALNAISALEDSNRTLLDRNAGLTKHNHELSNLKTPEPDQLLISVLKQRDEAQKQLGEVNRRASLLGAMNDALKEDLNDRNARVEELRTKIGAAHKEIVKLRSYYWA